MARTTAQHRSIRGVVLGLIFVLGTTLAGCSASAPAGESAAQTTQRILAIDGVSDATVDVRSSLSGFTTYRTTSVTITLDDGYTVGDADAALDWALRTGWAVNDESPNTSVRVGFFTPSGDVVDWDWAGAATAHGLVDPDRPLSLGETGQVSFPSAMIASHLGKWPGEVPTLPDDLFVKDE